MFFSKKLILLFIIFSLYLYSSSAVSFDATPIPINDRIIIDEEAKYKIEIKNNLNKINEYRIYNLDFPIWDIRTEPLVNPITLELKPGETGSVELIIDPLKIKDIGTYQVNVNVRSKITDEVSTVPIKVSILSTEPLVQGYTPTVITSVGLEQEIDPRKDFPIRIVLNNQNIIDYELLEMKISSSLFNEVLKTSLGPKGEKTLDLSKSIDPFTPPQETRIIFELMYQNRSIINPITKQIEIIKFSTQDLVKEDKNFLISKQVYRIMSNDPGLYRKLIVETTLLDSIFSSTKPEASISSKDGKRVFTWDVTPETKDNEFTITKNYIPLFAAIILIFIAIISYYTLRSPLNMIKEARNLLKKEGGISEMNIILHVKNRGQKKITDVEVNETIPGLVNIGKDVPIGSLQPSKVLKHEKEGTTIIRWNIDFLDPSEERVLSYKVKSQLSILGDFNMPSAKATFNSEGKFYTSTSNRLNINN
jgi:hypothetical protein